MAKKELPILNFRSTDGQAQKPRLSYDCSKCPAYCCTYDWILVTKRDIQRLARRFELSYEAAERKYTKFIKSYGYRVLRHRQDHIFKSACQFLHPTKRNCTIYEHRPATCRAFPEETRCGYYDFLTWEREHQDDESFIPLHQ
ncbi:MAG: YkgJ family cysteine cluster protein [Blastocatellia bacterium]